MPLICIIVVFGQYSYIRMWALRESVGEIRWIRGTTVCMGTSFKCAGDTRGGEGGQRLTAFWVGVGGIVLVMISWFPPVVSQPYSEIMLVCY